MLKLFKKQNKEKANSIDQPVVQEKTVEAKQGFLTRLSQGLRRTRAQFGASIANIFLGKQPKHVQVCNHHKMHLSPSNHLVWDLL